ncbi:MAG: pantetheine-phosphate adenylyltransferase [Bacillaceae bacterium]|nr:pantetheine-phosphate adenylyltransferase [Bacillaceae bacterium]
MKRTAIYPGSFDPITLGHLDIIQRASEIFDHVVVAIFENPQKKGKHMFSVEERIDMIEGSLRELGIDNATAATSQGLLVRYMEEQSIKVIIKGLRAVSDFEFEFSMAMVNKKLNDNIETLFMMTDTNYSYLSSSVVRELAGYREYHSDLITHYVHRRLVERFGADP